MMRSLHRTYALPVDLRRRDRRGRAPAAVGARRASPANAIRSRANDGARRGARQRARAALSPRKLASTPTGMTALKRKPTENEAEGRAPPRPCAARASPRTSHVDRSIGSARRGSVRRRSASRGSSAPRATARYEVNAAPFDVADVSARRAVRAHAERRAHQRDDRRRAARSPSCAPRSASTRRRSSSRRRRSTTRAQARLYIAPPALNPKADRVRRARRADHRRVSRSHARAARSCCSPRTRGCAKCTRCCASAWRFRRNCKANCRARTCSTGSARRPTPCCSRTGTFWEGIDVVGDQLSCVIIDRLPFPVARRSARRGAAWRRSKRAASAASRST